jgi:tripartite-type tricarboxylate transporter receptor subunit TctC
MGLMRVAATVLAAALALPVLAQTAAYPSRPVRMIIPAAPGGNPDLLARMLSQKLADAFGKPFIAENVPGAGGVVAAEQLAKAAPDGHTIMLGDSGALAINIALNSKLGYQPLRDFAPVTALMMVPTVLVVHPSVQANTLAEFIALAKSKPGTINYGSAGGGSIHHLTMAIFAARMGLDVVHVPYKGGTALVGGVLAGDVQAGFSGIPNVQQAIRAGRLRVLGISIGRRSASMPEVPTFNELGISGFDVATTIGMQVPAGTPKEIIARLQAVIAKALREKDLAERMQNLGMELAENGTEAYTQFMREDLERYAAAVKAAGIKPE